MKQKEGLFYATLALMLAVTGYWIMPTFALGGILLAVTSSLLAVTSAWLGARKIALLALYFCIAASLPFWVPRTNTFHFGDGYLQLALVGAALTALMLLFSLWQRRSN